MFGKIVMYVREDCPVCSGRLSSMFGKIVRYVWKDSQVCLER